MGWINSCGKRKGLDSSALKVFVMRQIYIHLCYWVIIAEDAVEVSIFDAIGEI